MVVGLACIAAAQAAVPLGIIGVTGELVGRAASEVQLGELAGPLAVLAVLWKVTTTPGSAKEARTFSLGHHLVDRCMDSRLRSTASRRAAS